MNRFQLSNYYSFNPLEGKKAKDQQIFVFRNNGVIHQVRKDCLYYDFGVVLIRNKDKSITSYITDCKQDIRFSLFYYDCRDEYSFSVMDEESSFEAEDRDIDCALIYLEKDERAFRSLMSTGIFECFGMTQISADYTQINHLREETLQYVYLLEGEGRCFKALRDLFV